MRLEIFTPASLKAGVNMYSTLEEFCHASPKPP